MERREIRANFYGIKKTLTTSNAQKKHQKHQELKNIVSNDKSNLFNVQRNFRGRKGAYG